MAVVVVKTAVEVVSQLKPGRFKSQDLIAYYSTVLLVERGFGQETFN